MHKALGEAQEALDEPWVCQKAGALTSHAQQNWDPENSQHCPYVATVGRPSAWPQMLPAQFTELLFQDLFSKLQLGKEWAGSEGTQQVPQPQCIREIECWHEMRHPPDPVQNTSQELPPEPHLALQQQWVC